MKQEKFIIVTDESVANKLKQSGFKQLPFNRGGFLFENNPLLKFNFAELGAKKIVFTNTMIF